MLVLLLLLLLLLLLCALILSFYGQQEKTMFIYLQKLTDLTVLSFKSCSTHTAVSFVCKTGLTGCSVLAKVIHTFVLGRKIYEIRAICFKVAAETLASLLTV